MSKKKEAYRSDIRTQTFFLGICGRIFSANIRVLIEEKHQTMKSPRSKPFTCYKYKTPQLHSEYP